MHGDIRAEVEKAAVVIKELEGVEDYIRENNVLCDLVRSCRQEFKNAVLGGERHCVEY